MLQFLISMMINRVFNWGMNEPTPLEALSQDLKEEALLTVLRLLITGHLLKLLQVLKS